MILFTKTLVCYTEDITQEEEIAHLKEQLRDVLEQVGVVSEHLSQVLERESQLLEQLKAEQAEKHLLHESLAAAHKRIEELEKQKTPPPTFVKANVKKPQAGEKQPRKKRAPGIIACGVGKSRPRSWST